MSFQKMVIYVALAILVILLVVIGINMHAAAKDATWPPMVGDCPDYWHDEGTKGSKCVVNTDDVNKGDAASPKNFNVAPFNTSGGRCAKYRWAVSNDVSWDGITYGVTNPCLRTTGAS